MPSTSTNSSSISIRVMGYGFVISARYSAGQVINEAEAQALNALRARNIKDNLSGVVRKALEGAKGGLGPEQLAELQLAFTNYDAGYQLQPKPGRGAIDRLGREIEALAQERSEEHFRQLGQDPSEQEFEDMVLAMSTMPSLVTEAQKRLAAVQAIVLGSIDDLKG